MNKHPHPAIHVAATKDNFRRVGREFGTVPQTIPLAALSQDQHDAILGDRSLVVLDTVVHLDETEAASLAHHDAPHVKHAATQMGHLAPHVAEDDAKRALALADIEAEMEQREASIKLREANLKAAENEFEEVDANLKRRIAEFDERYAGLVTRENDLLARVQAFEEAHAAKPTAKSGASK